MSPAEFALLEQVGILKEQLAQTQSKLAFAETKLAAMVFAATDAIDGLDAYVDVDDSNAPDVCPNYAMRITEDLDRAIALAKMPWDLAKFCREGRLESKRQAEGGA